MMVPNGTPIRLIVVDSSAEWPDMLVLISSELPWNDEGMWAVLRELAEDRDDLEARVIQGPNINADPIAFAWPNGEWMGLNLGDDITVQRSA